MKKKTLNFLCTLILAILLSQFLPWWSVMLSGFVSALIIPLKKASVFVVPCLAILLLWVCTSYYLSASNDFILAKKISVLLPLKGNFYVLMLLTGLIGGIAAGVAAICGKQLSSILKS